MRRTILILLAAAITLLGALIYIASPVHAQGIQPYPKALQTNRILGFNDTGANLRTAFSSVVHSGSGADPGNCTNPDTSNISVSGSSVSLNGTGSNCLYLESPHTYPTADGYVYEESINVTNLTNWWSFWGYGVNWPVTGEIDSIEASPTGQNNVSWHDSTSAPTGYSNCNNANGCDGNALPIDTPNNSDSLAHAFTPGTHIVDFAFGGCGSGCGAVSVWYDGTEVAYIHGTNVLQDPNTGTGGSQNDPFWIVDSNGKPENGSNTSGAITVNYLRIWRP